MSDAPLRVMQIMGHMGAGGVESTVLNHYRALDRTRVQFDFVVNAGSTHVPRDEIEAAGGRVWEVPGYKRLPAYLNAVADLCRQHRPMIVHSHVNALSVFPLAAGRRAGVPVRIAHSHSTSAPAEPVREAAKLLLRSVSRTMPTDLAACSDHAAAWLFGKRATSGGRVHLVKNALDIERFAFRVTDRVETRRALGLSDEDLVVGCVGRLSAQKNQVFLLEAFARLLQLHGPAVLLLLGEGPLREQLAQQAHRLGVSDHVRFLGARSDTASLYAAMDVLAFPSLYEGLGMVAVEAQASSLPTVISDRVPDEAVIVDELITQVPLSAGAEEWAQALRRAGGAPRESHEVASRLASAGYSIPQSAADLTGWYEDLASRATRGA